MFFNLRFIDIYEHRYIGSRNNGIHFQSALNNFRWNEDKEAEIGSLPKETSNTKIVQENRSF